MSLNWKLGLSLLILSTLFITTPFFGSVETRQFSAYAACRKVAMATKAYATWTHVQTNQKIFMSQVRFSDGINSLDCQAIGIGPFWMVRKALPTLLTCDRELGDGMSLICPVEYFGVSP
jgi:hypothetical protein